MTEKSALIALWYERSKINYAQYYISLYIAFNAWYRNTTGYSNDREALNKLIILAPNWQKYTSGNAMRNLRYYMDLLVEYTLREPLSYATPHWRGEVASNDDWPSLVEYWYRVRCLLMHGSDVGGQYVYLAYMTLNVYFQSCMQIQGD